MKGYPKPVCTCKHVILKRRCNKNLPPKHCSVGVFWVFGIKAKFWAQQLVHSPDKSIVVMPNLNAIDQNVKKSSDVSGNIWVKRQDFSHKITWSLFLLWTRDVIFSKFCREKYYIVRIHSLEAKHMSFQINIEKR